MLSQKGEILYIGMAKNIPNRLKAMWTDSNLPIEQRMLSLTNSLEVTTTSNESEALFIRGLI